MGIKTYSVQETIGILRDHGFNVESSGNAFIYIKGKVILSLNYGLYTVYSEDNGGVRTLHTGFDEDEACRCVLEYLNLKTVRHKSKA
jgi:hypothetical protein